MAPGSDVTTDSTDRKARQAAGAAERGPEVENAGSESPERDHSDREPDNDDSRPSEPDGESATPAASQSANPPLPNEPLPPPLPNEPLPDQAAVPDDGWEPIWDQGNQAFYFHNRVTGATQWENPRVPEVVAAAAPPAPGTEEGQVSEPLRLHGGYNPAIHGDYDPNASYALEAKAAEQRAAATAAAVAQPPLPGQANEADYSATGQFNRFTGRWQAADLTPENHNDEAKSKRQMNAYFDVDAAANSHEGRSLKAERSGMKLSKAELKAFKEKRRERKEEKRRAWLRD